MYRTKEYISMQDIKTEKLDNNNVRLSCKLGIFTYLYTVHNKDVSFGKMCLFNYINKKPIKEKGRLKRKIFYWCRRNNIERTGDLFLDTYELYRYTIQSRWDQRVLRRALQDTIKQQTKQRRM